MQFFSWNGSPTQIEIVHPDAPRGRVRFALFDFDGTLSLIREGWQGVMIPYFTAELRRAPDCETEAEAEAVVREFVETLTGKQTIYQCLRLAEEIKKRGGEPQEPLDYKREYHARLWERVAGRVAGLKDGSIPPDDLLLAGSRAFLEALQARGVTLYLASGTDIEYVLDEAAALDVARYFEDRIYGALTEYRNFSKRMIIERILRENGLHGPELLLVGDGYVEIENGKEAGGIALGIASDEARRGGLDTWKRRRLLGAGADLIARDFQETEALMGWLGG